MADTRTVGLLRRDEIVKQLAHVAAVKGYTAEELNYAGMPTWHALAIDALGLDREGRTIEDDVVAELRHQEHQ